MGGEESFRSFPCSIASTSHLSSSPSSSPSDRYHDATGSRRPLCEYEEFSTFSWRSAASWTTDESGSFSRIQSIGSQASGHADDALLEELEKIRQEVLGRLSRQGLHPYLTREARSWLRLVDDEAGLAKKLQERRNSRLWFSRWQSIDALKLRESIAALVSTGRVLLDALRHALIGHEGALLHSGLYIGAAWSYGYILGIEGPEGVGKTRILQELLKEERTPFDAVIWRTDYLATPTSRIQDDIAKQIGLSLVGHEEEETRRLALRDALSNMRFLLVLDDLRGTLDLEAIGIPSSSSERRSKIVITSRSKKVCNDMGAGVVIDVPVLPEQQSWELFRNAVGDAALEDPGAEEMARELVRGCGGLPSAIIGFAEAMKDVRSADEWRHHSEHPHLLRELGVIAPQKSAPVVYHGMVHAGGGRYYLREDIDDKGVPYAPSTRS